MLRDSASKTSVAAAQGADDGVAGTTTATESLRPARALAANGHATSQALISAWRRYGP